MKKILALTLAGISTLMLLAGCGNKEVTQDKNLTFGILPAESAIPIIIAKEKGFFEKEGINLDLQAFNAPNDRDAAVQAGKIDGIIADTMTSLTYHEAGIPMKITSDINEDFKLLTSPNSGIDTFEKLNNKDVSIVPNYVLEYIMDKMAEKNNIKYKITMIPSFTARFEALLSDQISGVIFTEPQATMLAAKGAKVLATSKEYGIKAGSILFSESSITGKSNAIKNFYKAYNDAIDYMSSTDAKEYSEILKKYNFPDAITGYLNGNAKYEKAGQVTEETFVDVLKWTKSKGTVKKDYKFEDVSNFEFIK